MLDTLHRVSHYLETILIGSGENIGDIVIFFCVVYLRNEMKLSIDDGGWTIVGAQ